MCVGVSLEDACRQFVAEYEYGGSPKTHKFYGDMVGRALCRWLTAQGLHAVEDVQPQHLRDFLREESQRLAPYTLHLRYTAMRRFFNWCVEQGYIDDSPINPKIVKRPRVPEGTREGFTKEEAQRLVQYSREAHDPIIAARDRAMVMLLLGTGCRAAELLGMKLRDLDFANGRVLLHRKGGRDQRVALGRNAAAALRVWLRKRYRVESEALWLSQQRRAMDHSTLAAMLHRLGGYAGVEDVTAHRFRHTAATLYYMEHRDLLATRAFLGHAQVEVTMRYLRRLGLDYALEANYSTPDALFG